MAKSDVFLRENRVEVVGGDGREQENGREQGDLEVTVDKRKEPSVTLNADRANVTLGGGAGNAPEGDVKLLDGGGTNRVQISAESDVQSRDKSNAGDQTVWINGGGGTIQLAPRGSEWGTIEPSAVLDGSQGTLELANPGGSAPDVTLDAGTGDVDVGGPDGEAGEIVVRDLNDDEAISVSATSDEVERGPEISTENVALYEYTGITTLRENDSQVGGIGAFQDGNATSVEIQGNTGSIRLGYSYTDTTDTGGPVGTDVPVGRGKGGSIFLDDGNPGRFLDNSQVFEIRASEGTLQVATDGGTLFELDPSAGELKIPDGWTLEDSLPAYSP
jgi:hypothetical protein